MRNIHKFSRMTIALLVLLMLIFSFSSIQTFAASESCAVVEIPVENKCEIIGDQSAEAETFVFELEAVDGAVMPESGITVSITGDGKAKFGKIEYKTPGDYFYKVKEVSGTKSNYTYDTTIYNVQIRAEYTSENGVTGMVTSMYVTRLGDSAKSDNLCFVNKYKSDKNSLPLSTQPDKDNESNPGTKARSGILPQTGMLWWPILLVGGLGILFIIVGLLMKRKKESET